MDIFGFISLIIALTVLERLREIIEFDSWFNNSLFSKIKNERIYKWFRSNDEDEFRRWYPFKWITKYEPNMVWLAASYVPMHPIFWDAYHFFKNLSFAIILVAMGYPSGFWWMLFASLLVMWIQEGLYKLLVCTPKDSLTRK